MLDPQDLHDQGVHDLMGAVPVKVRVTYGSCFQTVFPLTGE